MGFSDIDTSYALSNFTAFLLLMTATLMFGSALAEINGEMSLKTFAYYHYLLSAFLIAWQLDMFGGGGTDLGKAMFCLPHVFTLWGTLSLVGDDKAKTN